MWYKKHKSDLPYQKGSSTEEEHAVFQIQALVFAK